MRGGYAGRIGWIDLSTGTVLVDQLEEETARKYLGGKGLGAHLLWKHLPPHTDPFHEDNLLIFATGPLTGTVFPAVSRSVAVTRSPLTGTFLDSYSGGVFGSQLKWAGFDALVVRGRAPGPCYLHVKGGEVAIRGAAHLWGLSTSETEKRLKGELRDESNEKLSVAAIGQAGENLVRFAGIINERRAHGRGGAGAVMGSKNLKAVVAQGKGSVPIADQAAFREVVQRCRQKIAQHPLVGKGGAFPQIGTMMTFDLTQETGTLPTRNWQENTFADAHLINSEGFLEHSLKRRSCYACPIGCSRDARAVIDGREYVTQGPEYETMYAFGSDCAVSDPAVIIAADALCDDYGMDTISCGATIAFAMDCFEKGLLSPADTGGLEITFGNGAALLETVHLIGRREGIGSLLAEGVKRASESIAGSRDLAFHVKGMELPGYDPRGMKGQALTYALADRGGCHLRSNMMRTELLGVPRPVDRLSYDGKARIVADLQVAYAAFDCVIACLFGAFAITLQDHADAVAAATGWDFTLDELRTVAERAWNLTRLFNGREGFARRDDALPPALFTRSSTRGPSKGQVVEAEKLTQMLDEFYPAAGWDPETGRPTAEKVAALGLVSE